jgi:hypothetical protein
MVVLLTKLYAKQTSIHNQANLNYFTHFFLDKKVFNVIIWENIVIKNHFMM